MRNPYRKFQADSSNVRTDARTLRQAELIIYALDFFKDGSIVRNFYISVG